MSGLTRCPQIMGLGVSVAFGFCAPQLWMLPDFAEIAFAPTPTFVQPRSLDYSLIHYIA